MKYCIVFLVLILALAPLDTSAAPQIFYKDLPGSFSVRGWEKQEGLIDNEKEVIFYELYAESPSANVYGVLRYIVVRAVADKDGDITLVLDSENLQIIEKMRARHFQLDARRCWKKLFLGRCRFWREIDPLGAERKKQVSVILAILNHNSRGFNEEQ
ncbi:MAG: hypothetical protein AAB897_03125 [Patescibacteria group bacterium]